MSADAPADAGAPRLEGGPHAWLCILSAFALGQGSLAGGGMLSPAALLWLVVSLVSGALAVVSPGRLRLRPGPEVLLLAALVVVQATQLVVDVPLYPIDTTDTTFFRLAVALSAAALLGAVRVIDGRGARPLLALALASWLAAQLWALSHSFPPFSDVYLYHHDASAALLAGENPYGISIPNLYGDLPVYAPGSVQGDRLMIGYPYPPLSLLLSLPAYLLGDVRLSQVLLTALVAAAVGVLRRSTHAWLALGLYLFTPMGFWVTKLGYTEPFVVACLAATVLASRRRPALLAVLFGLLLASKQTMVFAAPLVLLLVPAELRGRPLARLAALACGVAALVILPLALWDPGAFWRSVVVWQFEQPFRFGCLSLLAALADVIGREPPRALVAVTFVLAGVGTWLAYRFRRPSSGSFSLALGFVLLVFFLFNKQAFPNYYLMVIAALCLAVVADGRK